MSTSPGLLIVIFLIFGRTHGDSVTQMGGQVILSEHAVLTINCTYTASRYPTLLWYVQYPGEGPQVLLKAMKASEQGSNKGFEATYDKAASSFHLEKASVQESDSAVYYCALSDTVAGTVGGAEHKLSSNKSPGLVSASRVHCGFHTAVVFTSPLLWVM